MDIFEFAMQMEQDGEKFYRALAEKSDNPGFRSIFTMMAEDEVKHYHIFQQMKTGAPAMPESQVLTLAKNIFQEMIETGKIFDANSSQLELYQEARTIEKKSRDFYREKAMEVPETKQRELLLQIAAEEERHYFLLYNIIELVLRPQTWVENGEFVHLDEY
jgi:rubrerythrin